jgi:RimJ/RimL family protein N-acetyltransferase
MVRYLNGNVSGDAMIILSRKKQAMITLEYFTKDDFQQLIDWIDNEELMYNWTGSMFNFPLTNDKLEWYIDGTNDPNRSDALVYKAVDNETGQTVGHISLGGISRKNKAARISRVLVGKNCQGKGVCKAMIQAVLRIGFEELGLHRISLGVYDFNTSAIRCYKKCGFVHEGTSRDVFLYGGKYWSLIEMGILEDEWRAIQAKTAA